MRATFRTQLFSLFLIVAFLAIGSVNARAATIVFAGSVEGSQVSSWRTSSVLKTMDLDGNNIYGSLGALNWLGGYTGLQDSGSSTLGWAAIGWGTVQQESDYRLVDSIPNAPSDDLASIAQEYFTFQLTGTTQDYLGKTVRVGIMADVLGATEWSGDRAKGLQLIQTAGGTGDSTLISLRGGAAGNGSPDMYFFDITGIKPGDQFQILALNNVGAISFNPGYVAQVSWDIIPEPSAGLLLLLGSAGWLSRRRFRPV